MKTHLTSARENLNRCHHAANKSPLHLATIDLLNALGESNDIDVSLPIPPPEAEEKAEPQRAEAARGDGLTPAPRKAARKAARKSRK